MQAARTRPWSFPLTTIKKKKIIAIHSTTPPTSRI